MVKLMRFLVNKKQIVGVKGSLGGLPDAIVGYQGMSIGVRAVGRDWVFLHLVGGLVTICVRLVHMM